MLFSIWSYVSVHLFTLRIVDQYFVILLTAGGWACVLPPSALWFILLKDMLYSFRVKFIQLLMAFKSCYGAARGMSACRPAVPQKDSAPLCDMRGRDFKV